MPIIVRIKIAVEMVIAIPLFRHIVKFRSNIGIIYAVVHAIITLYVLTLCYLLLLYATYP